LTRRLPAAAAAPSARKIVPAVVVLVLPEQLVVERALTGSSLL
jgi:hypothetical protein